MRNSMKKLVLLLVVFLSAHLGATTYYVAKSGNDGNPGTQASPLLTIQAGVNKAYPGDLVMVLAGTYKGGASFPRSGTEGFPITVRGEVDGGGNPLAVIDNADSITATWIAAPEVGSTVYKAALGYTPTLILVDSQQILRFTDALMAGDSSSIGIGQWPGTGFSMLAFAADKKWVHPFSRTCSPVFWDGVGAAFGVVGDTTYIRFKDGNNPNAENLWACSGYPKDFYIDKDYITLEHLRIQGASYPVWTAGANGCVIQSCVIRHGFTRVGLNDGSNNAVRDNDISMSAYSAYFGEWGDAANDSITDPEAALRVMSYCFRKWMDGDIGAIQLINEDEDEISGNTIHNGHSGISLRPATKAKVFDNEFSYTSSTAIEQHPLSSPDSTLIYNNTMTHCDIAIRFTGIGTDADSFRRVYIYNNRSWSSPNLGQTLVIHEVADYDTNIFYGYAQSPDIWFYHNSFAGADYWANPAKYACDSMKMVNNVFSTRYLLSNMIAIDAQEANLFKAFDYNFLGGGFRYYAPLTFAMTDTMNQWPTDSTNGSVAHQVWPLGSEPDWVVPGTSTAYRAGLDLSDSFTIRGVTYSPLPGMTPGYFAGDKPNLGAVQSPDRVGLEQRDPGHGSVTPRPEFALAPNPANARDAMVRCVIPTGKVGKLTLRDVLGRTVKYIALVRSGITPLDLRGFAPGVYVAALDVGGPTISRKLIITAH